MTPYVSSTGFPLLLGLHGFGMLLVLCGVVLLLAWAIKHLSAAEQKKWGITLLIVGALLCIFTLFGGVHSAWRFSRKAVPPMMQDSALSVRGMMQTSSKAR